MEVMAFGLGGLLLLVAILGGGFELKEIRIPSVGWKSRLAAAITGIFFTFLGIGVSSVDPGARTNPLGTDPAPIKSGFVSDSEPSESIKPSLISAIRLADQVEADAFRTLNASLLYKAYVGEALRTEQNSLNTLKDDGVYQISTLEGQSFQSFKVSADKSRAEVRVIETWSTVVYRVGTDECVQKFASHPAPQTIHLVRGDNVWMVENIVHELDTQATEIPCE